jgi:hypothetical protein
MHHSLVSLLLLHAMCSTEAARILGIFPTPSISHQLPFQAIMKALAARGHQITVISTNPLKVWTINWPNCVPAITTTLLFSLSSLPLNSHIQSKWTRYYYLNFLIKNKGLLLNIAFCAVCVCVCVFACVFMYAVTFELVEFHTFQTFGHSETHSTNNKYMAATHMYVIEVTFVTPDFSYKKIRYVFKKVHCCIPSVMFEIRYTGVDRAAGYLRETGIRLVLNAWELIFTNSITTLEEKISWFIVDVADRWLQM